MSGRKRTSRILRFERRQEPLASRAVFYRRLAIHGGMGLSVVLVSLALGMVGYRLTEGMGWVDAFLNASMILSGMGPVGDLRTTGGKLFAGTYALFSGVAFLVVVGVMFAPLAHRLLHRLHVEEDPDGPEGGANKA
jgi:hypothetical protein